MSPTAAFIAGFEGCRLRAYQDQAEVWTIGYGCTGGGITRDTEWTQGKADAELERRVSRTRHVLEAMVEVPLTESQFTALCSLAYNIGLDAFEHSTLRRLLNEGNLQAAADQFPKWNRVHGWVSQGLTNRRHAERALFLKDIDA
jgi:lysozyme